MLKMKKVLWTEFQIKQKLISWHFTEFQIFRQSTEKILSTKVEAKIMEKSPCIMSNAGNFGHAWGHFSWPGFFHHHHFPICTHSTVWKFHNFSITQIFREIIFRNFGGPKTSILTFRGYEFWFLVNFCTFWR